MKRWLFLPLVVLAVAASGAPLRVALLDFEDLTGTISDPLLGGEVSGQEVAAKGIHVLGQQLLRGGSFNLIDRRDFIEQVEQLQLKDAGQPTPTKPSFLHAAQALRADAVVRGSLMSFSTGKEVVDQGGYRAEFSVVTVRVSLEALDSVDGSVIAMAEGVGQQKYRQTAEHHTVLGEDDVVQLLGKAVADATPKLKTDLDKRQSDLASREKVSLTVKSNSDPALVEIDGILVGTTPLADFQVYKGDHVITVGKAGHYDITKRVLFEADTVIDAPLFRFELTAEEQKQILEKSRLSVFMGDEGFKPDFIIDTVGD